MIPFDEARKLKRNDRVMVLQSGDTGSVYDTEINVNEVEPFVRVQLDGGLGLWTFSNFQIDHEEAPCPSPK